MYSWIFRHLPGPTWLKVIWALLLIVLIAYLLLEFGFPWVKDTFLEDENTIRTLGSLTDYSLGSLTDYGLSSRPS